jgi:antitoxin MazE
MIKTMIQHGNSSALVIDKPVMELLNINQDTPLEIVTDGRNIIISPVNDKKRLGQLRTSLEKINKKHSRTLKRLAE